METTENRRKKRTWLKVIIIVVIVLAIILLGAVILFFDELKIISSIRSESNEIPLYYMEIQNDYHFEEFLKEGGASSDKEVSAFITKCISKGFYTIDIDESKLACSVISASAPNGKHIWGRNFDWDASVPIIVKHTPQNEYASISTCDFKNITESTETVPDNIATKMLAIAALYVPMDGINEAGLCAADLEVNEGGMKSVDTDKPDLTITTAIRLILNKCATVQEAVDLLKQYDIHSSGGISHHIAVSDSKGTSAVLEFINGEIVAVPSNYVTNFNLANGDTSAGGESAKERYELLRSVYDENNGILTAEQAKDALMQVSKSEGEWTTQWSVVYNSETMEASYWFLSDYNKVYTYSVGK